MPLPVPASQWYHNHNSQLLHRRIAIFCGNGGSLAAYQYCRFPRGFPFFFFFFLVVLSDCPPRNNNKRAFRNSVAR